MSSFKSEITPLLNPTDVEKGSNKSLASGRLSKILPKNSGFGKKTINFFGGFSLLVNNMTGPGMVLIPPLLQAAGWFTPILCMIVFCIVATFSSTMLCEAMSRVPGNEKFQGRIELTTLAKVYFGRLGFYITIILFVFSLQSMNIASIIESAQTMDITILAVTTITCGLEFFPSPGFICARVPGTDASPFGSIFIISIGFIFVLLIAIPLGYYNLDDNIIVQKIAFSLFMFISVEWICFFFYRGLDFSKVPMFGKDQTQVLGTIVFNYAYVVSVPSWVNEKKEEVSINKSLWGASILSTLLFVIIGIMGSTCYQFSDKGQDLLNVINSSALKHNDFFHILSRITVYVFPIVTQLSGIPVFSIIIRYNLLENKICGKFWANMWSVIFPWVVAVPFYTGSGLSTIIGWTSLFVNGFINFVIPLLLFIMSHKANFEKRRPQMIVHTLGAHHQTVLSAEISTNNGSINFSHSPHDTTQFEALPHKMKPHWWGSFFICFTLVGVIASIIINIYLAV